jgi:hypothetical protein
MIDINLCDLQELSTRILCGEKTLVTVNAPEEAVGFYNAPSSSNLRSLTKIHKVHREIDIDAASRFR